MTSQRQGSGVTVVSQRHLQRQLCWRCQHRWRSRSGRDVEGWSSLSVMALLEELGAVLALLEELGVMKEGRLQWSVDEEWLEAA